MASSSTSSISKRSFKYDVFLSFRGEDTRTSFVDHLYHTLMQRGIETYKDDKNLEKGKRINEELIQAIEDSRFHIIVLSKNYASSSWCLDELAKIMECQKMHTEQTVYPIFYDVEPSEVRKQSGAYGEAFDKHKREQDVGKWRKALEDVASFSGWDSRTIANGHEVELIEMVVKEVSLNLPSISADDSLIGMRTRINSVVSRLNTFPDKFCMIGIWGMGGSGKTTLARAVFDQICNQFEGSSFVENVRESSSFPFLSLRSLQKQILRDVLNRQIIEVEGVFDGKKMMKKYMPSRKVLVVLDDVDDIDQLKALAEPNWFMRGSRIIITTRDKQILLAHKVDLIHDVSMLKDEEAICLLSRCAFGKESPNPGYENVSQKVVRYAAGLPLTLTILGASLFDANEDIWIDTLKELEKIPLDGTLKKLALSYKGLDTNCKEIFLDIACLMKGWKKDEAIRALESCGHHALRGLNILEKRSLITTSGNGKLDMHDHIEEMGRYIVRCSNLDEPRRRNRLWIAEEIKDILVNNLGTESTTSINLFAIEINPETVMKGIGNMEKLRLLHVYVKIFCSDWKVDEAGQCFPNSLQYLNWYGYPFCSLPKTFQASNLVALHMCEGFIQQLWEGGEIKALHKLRFLRLSGSKLRTLNLGLTPNLENLDLQSCYYLVELHIPFPCPKLKFLNLNDSKLSTLDLSLTPNIEILNLEGCMDLVEVDMPHECPELKSFNLSCPELKSLNLNLTPNIEILNLQGCKVLLELDMPHECPELKSFNLSCPKLKALNLSVTPNIEILTLECANLVELHIPRDYPQLKYLNFICPKLRSLNPTSTPNIEALELEECSYLSGLDMSLECRKLESFNLEISKLRTLDLGPTPNLETLNLQGCYDLVELRMHCECCKLKSLSLGCPQLRNFDFRQTLNFEALTLDVHDDLVEALISVGYQKLKSFELVNSKLTSFLLTLNLKTLILENCDLVELHIPEGDAKLKSLAIKRCSKLKTLDLGRTPNLESLHLEECSSLVKLHAPVGGLKELINLQAKGVLRFTNLTIGKSYQLIPQLNLHGMLVGTCPLHPNNSSPKFQFECSYKEDLPSSIGNIEKLISVGFSCACTNLESFFESICGLQHLGDLRLEGVIPEVPKDLDRLQCLESLTLRSTSIKHLPDSILLLKHLKYLNLMDCKFLEKLPDDLGQLECLEKLYLSSEKIKHLPDNICMLKHLKILQLFCEFLEKLPEDLGRLECLEKLTVDSKKIKHLPDSICMVKHLKSLELCNCELLEKLPEDLGRLECLEDVTFKSIKIKHLPDSICMLKHLKSLKLSHCELLEKLPEDLGRLECLHTLEIKWCTMLRDIPNSICRLKCLMFFSLHCCNRIEELRDELGRLECLKLLDIRGTCIKKLPQSILVLEGLRIAQDETPTTASTGDCCTVL